MLSAPKDNGHLTSSTELHALCCCSLYPGSRPQHTGPKISQSASLTDDQKKLHPQNKNELPYKRHTEVHCLYHVSIHPSELGESSPKLFPTPTYCRCCSANIFTSKELAGRWELMFKKLSHFVKFYLWKGGYL